MQFTSLPFAYFFVLVGSVAWLLRERRTWQKVWLLLASYFFYARLDLRLFLLLAGASLGTYWIGELLWRQPDGAVRRWLLRLGVLLNVLLLSTFKFYDFFRERVAELADLLGLESHLPVLEIFLPAGISFYVFQGIAYLVDIPRGKAVKPQTPLDFLLFMALFPKLMAGPLTRSSDLLPQLHAPAPKRLEHASEAMVLIASGLFKKLVLAGYLSTHMVEEAFEIPANFSSLELTVAMFAYTAEVYLDFSGYTDMARGLGLLLGFRLPENFAYPYAASDIGEFWKRWHISFSRWLREYIYFPLGGSRGARLRTSLNLILTFMVCGIWHGARWGFILWGALHGVALAAYKLSVDFRRDWAKKKAAPHPPPKPAPKPGWWLALGCFATMSYCALVRVFFRASDIDRAFEFYAELAELTVFKRGIDYWVLWLTVLTFVMNLIGRRPFELAVSAHERIPSFLRPVVWAGFAVLVLALKTRDVSPYIYFGF